MGNLKFLAAVFAAVLMLVGCGGSTDGTPSSWSLFVKATRASLESRITYEEAMQMRATETALAKPTSTATPTPTTTPTMTPTAPPTGTPTPLPTATPSPEPTRTNAVARSETMGDNERTQRSRPTVALVIALFAGLACLVMMWRIFRPRLAELWPQSSDPPNQ